MKRAIFTAASAVAALALGALALGAAPAGATTGPAAVYDATPAAGTANLPSVGAEAYAFKEIGDQITFAGTARTLNAVTVTMSSWGCETGSWFANNCVTSPGAHFTVPITLNVYDQSTAQGDGTVLPGGLLTRVTKKFSIAYRPSANHLKCTGGRWYNKADLTCYNGKAANITFNFTSLGLELPDTVVLGLSYNTTHYGYKPIGEAASCFGTSAGCAYDSLNVGLNDAVAVGSKSYPDTVFQNSDFAGEYCTDGGAAVGVFNLDSPNNACWNDGTNTQAPAIRVTAH